MTRTVSRLRIGWLTKSYVAGSNASPDGLRQRPLDAVVVDDPPDRGQDVAALAAQRAVLRQVVA